MASPSVTIDDLRSFHSVDRDIYTRLVMNLLRNPVEALQIMAFWVWIEESGFPNIITKMESVTNLVLNSLVEEAKLCLNYITKEVPPPASTMNNNNGIPIMRNLMNDKQKISFEFLHEHRLNALCGITKTMKNLSKVFDDIIQQAMANAAAVVPPPSSMFVWRGVYETGESSSPSHQSNLNVRAVPWSPADVPHGQRTMFITFSRGYPISESEVLNFFSRYARS
ncbi:hypothetical protein BVC80_1453g11 [Macleaya cordata]|uniref:Uncharacterized protein n=1 Tax=Macleaya cordata TaxID=56857 RepID=A0A200PPG8_MACCD|nr:hypothetical protein BVC80_1453g10 [Macleaya cordata]OVA00093.1 hypothetical protein BVC80_1453g11 [Macleaya cordata]